MPFEPLTPEEQKQFPKPCSDPQHNPPGMIVLLEPMKWVCPACGESVILRPNSVRLVAEPVQWQPDHMACNATRRTKSQVIAERRNAVAGGCLAEAVCDQCGGSGYAVHPENGWNRNARRCSRGCRVVCSICSDPNCDNPGGQH